MAVPRTIATSPFPQPAPARIGTLAEIPRYLRTRFPREVVVGRCRAEHDETFSTTQFCDRVQHVAIGLIARGVHAGDRVAILSPSRPEWLLADLAALSIGAVTVPVYPTLAPAQTRYILEHSGSRLVFVSDLAQAAKVQTARHLLPDLEGVVVFDLEDPAGAVGAAAALGVSGSMVTLADFETRGRETLASTPASVEELDRRIDAVQPSDLATIIYTSGTTGEPKGVMLSHHNIVSNVVSCDRVLGCSPADTALSFLPLSHAFERTVAYIYLYEGVTVMFAESIDTLARDLRRTRPTLMTGVPRMFEKLHARVMENVAATAAPRRKLFDWALVSGHAHARMRLERSRAPLRLRLQHAIADRLVFAKIRSRTGTDRARLLVSGSAPLSREVCAFFHAIGLLLIEGYGLTETAPVLTVSPLDAPRLGTVGCAIPGVELATAEDGEVLARGPNIMLGYYKRPEATAEMLHDGWLYTGDIGALSDDGYLTITDRKKDLLITSGGKHVAPQPIEDLLKRHPLVAEAMLIGDRRPFIAALIVPSFAVLEPRLAAAGLHAPSREAACARAETQAIYQEIVDGVNADLAQYERIKRVILLPTEFSVGGGELTPTLKVRRSIVTARWQNVIEALYKESAHTAQSPGQA